MIGRRLMHGLAILLTLAWSHGVMGDMPEISRNAFSLPLAGLSDADRQRFADGRLLFQRSWVQAPSADEVFDGLGPLHSRLACISCHPGNGRGQAPELPSGRLLSMAVLIASAADEPAGSHPHPVYGVQLNEESRPGIPAEGSARLHWHYHDTSLSDGTVAELRRPEVVIDRLAYGPLDNARLSPRVGPAVAGLGLLEAVPDVLIADIAEEMKPDGVRGRVNWVRDPHSGELRAGRFGYKASAATLLHQSAKAMHVDLGITSALFPSSNCTAAQTECLLQQAVETAERVASGRLAYEIGDRSLSELVFYLQQLAPPDVPQQSAESEAGLVVFTELGCAVCHRPSLNLPDGTAVTAYTDLLLHDMGEGLADGHVEHSASGRDWRTAPLWGLGLVARLSDQEQYLHDGRARTITEAILWHGGEATVAVERFRRLSDLDREALLNFLKSL